MENMFVLLRDENGVFQNIYLGNLTFWCLNLFDWHLGILYNKNPPAFSKIPCNPFIISQIKSYPRGSTFHFLVFYFRSVGHLRHSQPPVSRDG